MQSGSHPSAHRLHDAHKKAAPKGGFFFQFNADLGAGRTGAQESARTARTLTATATIATACAGTGGNTGLTRTAAALATRLLRAGMRMRLTRCIAMRTTGVALARGAIATRLLGTARRAIAPTDRGLRLVARHVADFHVAAQHAHDLA